MCCGNDDPALSSADQSQRRHIHRQPNQGSETHMVSSLSSARQECGVSKHAWTPCKILIYRRLHAVRTSLCTDNDNDHWFRQLCSLKALTCSDDRSERKRRLHKALLLRSASLQHSELGDLPRQQRRMPARSGDNPPQGTRFLRSKILRNLPTCGPVSQPAAKSPPKPKTKRCWAGKTKLRASSWPAS